MSEHSETELSGSNEESSFDEGPIQIPTDDIHIPKIVLSEERFEDFVDSLLETPSWNSVNRLVTLFHSIAESDSDQSEILMEAPIKRKLAFLVATQLPQLLKKLNIDTYTECKGDDEDAKVRTLPYMARQAVRRHLAACAAVIDRQEPDIKAAVLGGLARLVPHLIREPALAQRAGLLAVSALLAAEGFGADQEEEEEEEDMEESSKEETSEEEEKVVKPPADDTLRPELGALSLLVTLVKALPYDACRTLLQTVYTEYLRACVRISRRNMPRLAFLRDTCLALFRAAGTKATLRTGSAAVRQLGLHLRAALRGKGALLLGRKRGRGDVYADVANWRFLRGLELWCLVAGEEGMNEMLYPITEIGLGLMRVLPRGLRHAPARLFAINCLNTLALRSGALIPTTDACIGALVDALRPGSLTKQSKNMGVGQWSKVISTRSALLDLSAITVAPQGLARTPQFRKTVVADSLHLYLESLVAHAQCAAFPEIVLRPQTVLARVSRAIKRRTPLPGDEQPYRWPKQLSGVVADAKTAIKNTHDAVQSASKWMKTQRDALDASPEDLEALETWERALTPSPLHEVLVASRASRTGRVELQPELFNALRALGPEESSEDSEEESEGSEEEKKVELPTEGVTISEMETARKKRGKGSKQQDIDLAGMGKDKVEAFEFSD